ncbi:MAG: transcriptional repressor [Actinomycetota bacterium]|nr:transcriptional repressor [Actinomycetota bacterium]HZY66037.1 Fur family transcriptional regulator [Rubrobacteraceae bacterium]
MKLGTAIGKMRGRGYKATPQRVAVLEALRAEQHQSLADLRRRCPRIGMVTVYRTLDLLTDLGLVRRLDLGDGPRYELAEDHHHHMICESCGDISEFDQCPIDPARLPGDGAFEVNSHSVEVYGLCAACR